MKRARDGLSGRLIAQSVQVYSTRTKESHHSFAGRRVRAAAPKKASLGKPEGNVKGPVFIKDLLDINSVRVSLAGADTFFLVDTTKELARFKEKYITRSGLLFALSSFSRFIELFYKRKERVSRYCAD